MTNVRVLPYHNYAGSKYKALGMENSLPERLPHPIRKATALAYILKNTRISCDKRDNFPAINMIDHPLNSVLTDKWSKELFEEIIPDIGQKREFWNNMHINVFDADTLGDAQNNPENYQDLQIRVCGWNVLWNNINKV